MAALRSARMQLLLELVAARLEARSEIAHGLQVAHQLILLELQLIENKLLIKHCFHKRR